MTKRILKSFLLILSGYFTFWLIHAGFHSPPNSIRGGDLGKLDSLVGCGLQETNALQDYQAQWKIWMFQLVDPHENQPDAFPCTLELKTSSGNFKGFRAKNSNQIYFSFVPRYTHGWFNTPALSPTQQKSDRLSRPLYSAQMPEWIQSLFIPYPKPPIKIKALFKTPAAQ